MESVIALYAGTLSALVITGIMMMLQVMVADLASIKSKHPPGVPIPADSASFLFRSSRAFANTNETIAIFILFAVTGVLISADPTTLCVGAWAYLACRVLHMLSYYANLKLIRSTVFGLSLVALLVMGFADVSALLKLN